MYTLLIPLYHDSAWLCITYIPSPRYHTLLPLSVSSTSVVEYIGYFYYYYFRPPLDVSTLLVPRCFHTALLRSFFLKDLDHRHFSHASLCRLIVGSSRTSEGVRSQPNTTIPPHAPTAIPRSFSPSRLVDHLPTHLYIQPRASLSPLLRCRMFGWPHPTISASRFPQETAGRCQPLTQLDTV